MRRSEVALAPSMSGAEWRSSLSRLRQFGRLAHERHARDQVAFVAGQLAEELFDDWIAGKLTTAERDTREAQLAAVMPDALPKWTDQWENRALTMPGFEPLFVALGSFYAKEDEEVWREMWNVIKTQAYWAARAERITKEEYQRIIRRLDDRLPY